jgi:hypothetical protein
MMGVLGRDRRSIHEQARVDAARVLTVVGSER